jgi:hypothetical protein
MRVEMNCDMGESFGLYKMGDDEGMMPLISVANVSPRPTGCASAPIPRCPTCKASAGAR